MCFSGRLENQDDRPEFWLADTFLTSTLKPLNRIQQNLTGSKISKYSGARYVALWASCLRFSWRRRSKAPHRDPFCLSVLPSVMLWLCLCHMHSVKFWFGKRLWPMDWCPSLVHILVKHFLSTQNRGDIITFLWIISARQSHYEFDLVMFLHAPYMLWKGVVILLFLHVSSVHFDRVVWRLRCLRPRVSKLCAGV